MTNTRNYKVGLSTEATETETYFITTEFAGFDNVVDLTCLMDLYDTLDIVNGNGKFVIVWD
jgi:hypothetical protein